MHSLRKETEDYIDDAIAGLTKCLGVRTQVKKIVATALEMESREPIEPKLREVFHFLGVRTQVKKIVATAPIEPKLRQIFNFIERYRRVIQERQANGGGIDCDFVLRKIQEQFK